jgi:hypothetical protein
MTRAIAAIVLILGGGIAFFAAPGAITLREWALFALWLGAGYGADTRFDALRRRQWGTRR